MFNCLTGMNQKVGNFPGVTVEKKTGSSQLLSGDAEIIDLPGSYSLYPRRLDEWVSYKVLLKQDSDIKADIVIAVADASNLKRNLLFCTQLIDLKTPVIVALTMLDIAHKKGISIDISELERELGVPVVAVNPRKKKGVSQLKKAIDHTAEGLYKVPVNDFIDIRSLASEAIEDVKKEMPGLSDYTAVHYLMHHESFKLADAMQERIENIEQNNKFNHSKTQAEEILLRYGRIRHIMHQAVTEPDPLQKSLFTDRLDNVLLHRRWGYLILLAVLFLLFQSVFLLASYPMDWIDKGFASLSGWLISVLPSGILSDLLTNGIIAGLGGILMFVPQIVVLFALITILEDTGYMARISFLTDRLMRSVGLNGKSVMPMISGFACAIPAVMSARSIENRKERLLTILITPLMSCSARLPVYTILIGLVVPNKYFLGFIGLQGLVMLALYFVGFIMALIISYVAKWFIKIQERSFFILELPVYRSPRWKNVWQTMWSKAKIFVVDAGKVIMIISLILWALSSYGPKKKMQEAAAIYEQKLAAPNADTIKAKNEYANTKLVNSYVGIIGKAIEPAIEPLGYDWRIGIAIITSFAAREVFVGTMATLYSVGDETNRGPLKEKMKAAVRPDGRPVYSLASGVSLMLFYAFAMQCMSTLAVVRRETRSWKWPIIQLIYMTGLAYIISLIAYQLLKD